MAFNYSKGPQVVGDLKAADDAQRDTKIDLGEDYIGLETSGAVRMVISGSDGKVGIGTASPNYKLDIQGDIRVRGNDIRDNSYKSKRGKDCSRCEIELCRFSWK